MSIIALKDVSYTYKSKYQEVHALQSVTCAFERGMTYALLGKSGSGKSTMLSLMAGLDLPNKGDILFQGYSTNEMDLDEYRRAKVAMVYQDFRLFPMLTVLENIMYPMELCGIRGKEALMHAKEQAEKVALPENLFHRYPNMISGGEQQRVAIARALSMDRKLILADEPTGNLDSGNSKNIIDIMTKLAKEEKCCVIIATHDLSISPLMDCVVTMTDGKTDIHYN